MDLRGLFSHLAEQPRQLEQPTNFCFCYDTKYDFILFAPENKQLLPAETRVFIDSCLNTERVYSRFFTLLLFDKLRVG